MNNIKILGINGSSKGSTTHKLLERALGATKTKDVQTEIIHLPQPKAKWMLPQYDGIIMATPVHWFNISASMKEFIDSLTLPLNSKEDYANSPYPLDGIVFAFIAVFAEDGAQQAINSMLAPMNHMGGIIMPFGCFFYNINMSEKSQGGWQNNVEDIGERIVEFINCIAY